MSKYAPEYTKKEKINFFLKHSAWALLLLIAVKFYFTPWLEQNVEMLHCYNFSGLTGAELLSYGLFVGFPLSTAIIIFLVEGPRSIKVIKLGQSPLPGEKVLKPTKYTYGLKAKVKPIVLFVLLVFLVGVSIQGVFWANDFIHQIFSNNMLECFSS